MKPVVRTACLLLLLPGLVPLCARAERRLLPERISVAPVSEISIHLAAANEGGAPEQAVFPPELSCVLHGGSDRSERVVLRRAGGGADVLQHRLEPGAFVRVRYTLRLPPGFLGPVILDAPGFSPQPVMFSVQTAAPASLASDPAAGGEGQAVGAGSAQSPGLEGRGGERAAALRRATRVLPGVSAYDPVYFGLGLTGGLNAKFQFSLKYQPFDGFPVYTGFTQTSLWDLHSESKPFHDSAYRPSLFFLKEELWVDESARHRLGLQAGFEHESNGRGGLDTRSINIAFVRPRLVWQLSSPASAEELASGAAPRPATRLVFSPKLYAYLEKSENRDIAHYRGYADLYLALLHGDWKISTTLRKGTRGNQGSVQVDAVVPLRFTDRLFRHVGLDGVNGYWFLQYFNGWGESIIDYDTKRDSQVRAGLMVVP